MAEINLSDLFPKPMGGGITVRLAWRGLSGKSDAPVFSEKYKEYWYKAKQGDSVGKLNSVKKLDLNDISPTLTKNEGYGGVYHPLECRPISTAERKRLASFPDGFNIQGWQNATERIGNSVPPLFMYAIATQIKHTLWNGEPLENSRMTTDYPAHLEMMWQKHLAPRAADAPTVISTFAGGGGSSLGYSMAGFRELLAVEWDNNAVETFKLNFPDVPVYHGDIAKLSVDECLRLAGIKPGELDIFDGSPPCQGFSTAGKRVMDDPRNSLFKEYVRLLRGLRPKVFVMENVSGMVKGKMKLIFVEILKELKASGYKVSARLLNAMYFHVPQSRQRMIFIGVRDDLGIDPSHQKAEGKPIGIRHIVTDVKATRSMKINPWIFHPRPAATVTKTDSDYQFLTDIGIRKPLINEISKLGSYPKSFLWNKDAWQRIGNSVPPLFMGAIARHIRLNILDKTPVNLGES